MSIRRGLHEFLSSLLLLGVTATGNAAPHYDPVDRGAKLGIGITGGWRRIVLPGSLHLDPHFPLTSDEGGSGYEVGLSMNYTPVGYRPSWYNGYFESLTGCIVYARNCGSLNGAPPNTYIRTGPGSPQPIPYQVHDEVEIPYSLLQLDLGSAFAPIRRGAFSFLRIELGISGAYILNAAITSRHNVRSSLDIDVPVNVAARNNDIPGLRDFRFALRSRIFAEAHLSRRVRFMVGISYEHGLTPISDDHDLRLNTIRLTGDLSLITLSL